MMMNTDQLKKETTKSEKAIGNISQQLISTESKLHVWSGWFKRFTTMVSVVSHFIFEASWALHR
jgi:hypothetical protein